MEKVTSRRAGPDDPIYRSGVRLEGFKGLQQKPLDKTQLDAVAKVVATLGAERIGTLSPQEENLLNQAIHREITRYGIEALTPIRMEGLYELVTQHLWDRGFGEVL